MMIPTVGELRAALADCPDDRPCCIRILGPRSENPCSFEDEYGPGSSDHFLVVFVDAPMTRAVFHVGEDNSVAVGC